ncbi:hypothetical protein [Clostridium algidicarnis]|uniref:lysine 5,6-aminomutase reactivase subunit KamB n=1 Tax=Clostridium algidicarnis TaxID=37659 RepID=UPI001C0C812E|nr:hypothetical protein [Clostridium algidicarnis]MBU3193385.1 hypothetical protein [Clostridium algidicarnis]
MDNNRNTIMSLIEDFKTISIIGMDKNVGKTTVLNYIIQNSMELIMPLGITSIGRDGEGTDVVTLTKKPKIYVRRGSYIATVRQCLDNSDITKEIINTTGIQTPMGEVIIVKSLSDGYVDLGGPSVNSQMSMISNDLLNLGCEKVLVDGALGRRTFASPSITEATILSTGASLSKNMYSVVEKTAHTIRLLSIPEEEDSYIVALCNNTLESQRISIIYKNKSIKNLNALTSLDSGKDIVYNLTENVSYVFIKGILSDKLLLDIIRSTDLYKRVIFLVEDGTKLFLSEEIYKKFIVTGGQIRCLSPINVLFVTCNPKSPYGYEFNKDIFLNKLRESVDLPVFDVEYNA